jgi:hypothetical protein
VPEYADQIICTYKLPVFAKQPGMELFTAPGDDNGLLIIAAESRNWFPAQKPAQPFPGTVTIENNGETNILRHGTPRNPQTGELYNHPENL